MRTPSAARFQVLLAAALAFAVPAALAAAGAEKPAGSQDVSAREILLDLPADFPPLLCHGAIHLFSSGGRNQTMAPGESAPSCNLLQLSPAAPPLCGPDGPLVLTKDGTLWRLGGEGPQSVEQGLGGAVAMAALPGGAPAILFPDRLRLPSGEIASLALDASGLDSLPDGSLWISGKGAGARLAPDGKPLWMWKGGLTPTGAAMDDGALAVGTEEGLLVVLDSATGHERFRYPTGGAIPNSPRIEGKIAIFASRDHLVRAVRLKDGQLAWQVRLEGRPDFGPIPTRAGLVFAASASSTLVALDPADGRRTWTWRLPAGNVLQSPASAGEQMAVLGWGESENPTLYLVGVPEPSKPPAPPRKKARRVDAVAR